MAPTSLQGWIYGVSRQPTHPAPTIGSETMGFGFGFGSGSGSGFGFGFGFGFGLRFGLGRPVGKPLPTDPLLEDTAGPRGGVN